MKLMLQLLNNFVTQKSLIEIESLIYFSVVKTMPFVEKTTQIFQSVEPSRPAYN